MMLGHFLLAFTLASLAAILLDYSKHRALVIGLAAGCFAFIPDVDILYAWKELFVIFESGLTPFVDTFWSTSSEVHRGLSHSLIVGFLSSLAFTFYYRDSDLLTGIVVTAVFSAIFFHLLGFLGGIVAGAFSITGIILSEAVSRKTDLSLKEFLAVSALGLLSHPFGDIFTGVPPEFFYPLETVLLDSRIAIFQDPTLNLLLAFSTELFFICSSIAMFFYLTDRDLRSALSPLALTGVLYLGIGYWIPAPTLEVSYQFVFSIIGYSAFVGALPEINRPTDKENLIGFAVRSVSILVVAFTSYLVYYLLF